MLRESRLPTIGNPPNGTLLPVVVAAAPGTTLAQRLRDGAVLRALGVPDAAVEYEGAAMNEVVLGKTTSKQVRGILVDFGQLLPFFCDDGRTSLQVSLELARTPCSPLRKRTGFPDRETLALFAENTLGQVTGLARPHGLVAD